MTAGALEHVVFDLDGTLIDSADGILAGLAAALDAHGVRPRVAIAPSLIGPPLAATLARLAGTPDPQQLEPLVQSFKNYYDAEGYRRLRVFPGVEGLLDRLAAAGVALHIATNKRIAPTLAIVAHLGWDRRFASIYAPDLRAPPFRDKAETIASLLSEQTVSTGRCCYVGDREEDGHAAECCGVPFLFAAWGSTLLPANLPRRWRVAMIPCEVARTLAL